MLPASLDGDAQTFQPRIAPDTFELDVDQYGLTEDDVLALGIVEQVQIEDMEPVDDEDPFSWGPWE